MKHCLECLVDLLSQNKNGGVKSSKSMLINTGYPNLLKAVHTLGDQSQGLFAGTYPLVCTHWKIDRFEGQLVPATSLRNQTSLIRGTSRRGQKCGPSDWNFDAKYEYTLGDWSPKQVPATSLYD